MSIYELKPDYVISNLKIGLYLSDNLKQNSEETNIEKFLNTFEPCNDLGVEELSGMVIIGLNEPDAKLKHYEILDIADSNNIRLPERFIRDDIFTSNAFEYIKLRYDFYAALLDVSADEELPASKIFENVYLDDSPPDFSDFILDESGNYVNKAPSLSEKVIYLTSLFEQYMQCNYLILNFDQSCTNFELSGVGEYQNALGNKCLKSSIADDGWSNNNEFITSLNKMLEKLKDNVIPVNFGEKNAPALQAANDLSFEIYLLTGSKKNSKFKWYESPMPLFNWGWLELTLLNDDLNNVLVTITPNADAIDEFEEIFKPHSGKYVTLVLEVGGNVYVEAKLKVYPELDLLDGSGVIKDENRPDSNKLGFTLKPIGEDE